jgi:uncharacterized membrane protein HdeD (DUF308 family)
MPGTETSAPPALPPLSAFLRRLYLSRFVFAVVWAIVLLLTARLGGPLLTVLLVVYPLVDAASVLWQLRAEPRGSRSRASEWANVVVSVLVAIALGVSSAVSVSAALAVWGVWAIIAGIPQLITAVARFSSGGQVPQILSGGISVLAGASFLVQGLRGSDAIAGAGGYAILGGVFFLISAIRLGILLKRAARAAA